MKFRWWAFQRYIGLYPLDVLTMKEQPPKKGKKQQGLDLSLLILPGWLRRILWGPMVSHGGPLEALWGSKSILPLRLYLNYINYADINAKPPLETLRMKKYWKVPFLQQPPQLVQGRSGLQWEDVGFRSCPKICNAKNIYLTHKWIIRSPRKILLIFTTSNMHGEQKLM